MTLLTGFTLEVDGEPEAVARLAKAFFTAYDEMLSDAEKRERSAFVGIHPTVVYVRPLSPVSGKITVRTSDEPA